MKFAHSLGSLSWTLTGWHPNQVLLTQFSEAASAFCPDVGPLSAEIPGSVQNALHRAGLLPDWNKGDSIRLCDWVENRDWVFETKIPPEWFLPDHDHRLCFEGLDGFGSIYLNASRIGEFRNAFIPHLFELQDNGDGGKYSLRLLFTPPPRWLGQIGWTSQIREWKPRFNYTWDWVPRLVQIGIWDSAIFVASNGSEFRSLRCNSGYADGSGWLKLHGSCNTSVELRVRVRLESDGNILHEQIVDSKSFDQSGLSWTQLSVKPWWPNTSGMQSLYDLRCELISEKAIEDSRCFRVGFKEIEWTPCAKGPPAADPWLCKVNKRAIFLCGVNWSPIRPNFADVEEEAYRLRVAEYARMGFNLLRINGVSYPEKEILYRLCDEYGLMIWQDFPLSSSGIENTPPENPETIEEVAKIAESIIVRRQHHASFLMWCGGNELRFWDDRPITTKHPLIARLASVCSQLDSAHRFIASTATGPAFFAHKENFGKGIHWNVHGPWLPEGNLADWKEYWENDDSLFRAETGSPGASPLDLLCEYLGECCLEPVDRENRFWRRTFPGWLQIDRFKAENGRSPRDAKEFVGWSQMRQSSALEIALGTSLRRFPKIGGMLFWHGHDCFPCGANCSLLDFHGHPKPAAVRIAEILRAWRRKGTQGPVMC